ncbi:exodeoxyribonuclease V subunit gamma [Deferribacter abyssi]|uniref:exodeoxyribonuclease V subunit gamma n=1 Tax=Deferribacter abyssi TaxID=213806 RepID=UPI003C139EA5
MNNSYFKLYLSNDLVILLQELLNNIKNHQINNPLTEKQTIVVQTDGMVKWISLNIAEKFGICCNFEFLFPRNFILNTLKQLNLLTDEDINYFDKKNLTLEIIKILQHQHYKELEHYLSDDDGKKLGQFAIRMADIFDQYLTYRLEYILYPGKISTFWQQDLFRKIINNGYKCVAKAINEFLQGNFLHNKLEAIPDTINLFAISILPPIYINFIKKLSTYKTINLYSINPSQEYWFDDLSEKAKIRFFKKAFFSEDEFYFTKSNPLLINNGKLVQDFFSILYDTDPTPHEIENYNDFNNETALNTLKQKILNNDPIPFQLNDETIQIHSFHSRFREIEGIYNYILKIIQDNPDIYLEDIVVMCPDIDEYAPYIEGVFENKNIPYNISDSRILKQDNGIKALFSILDCLKKDLTVKEFVSLLEYDAIKEKFQINQTEQEIIREWINELNIRWGLTENFVKSSYPHTDIFNTFEYNVKRILLGYLTNENKIIFDSLPYTEQTVSNGETAGKFLYIIDKITHFINLLKDKRDLKYFKNLLIDIINTFIAKKYTETASFLSFLKELEQFNDETIEIFFPAFLELIKNITTKTKNSLNFMRGGITFCELVPLRSIPFKVICLIGMNDENFPRKTSKLLFNEMELKPKRGDRSSKLNDRLLFLESILSAKKYLYISFIGKDMKKNKQINPSIVVSELLDFLSFNPIEHPLHSFSPLYFSENRDELVNYNPEDFEAAKSLLDINEASNIILLDDSPLIQKELPKQLPLKKLIDFIKDPLKTFFKENGVYLEIKLNEIQTREDLSPHNLQQYKLRNSLINEKLHVDTIPYTGLLPHANIGKLFTNLITSEVEIIKKALKKVHKDIELYPLNSLNIQKEINSYLIEGKIEYVYSNSFIMIDFGKQGLDKRDFLLPQILIYTLMGNFNESYFINLNETKKITFTTDNNYLKKILEIYEIGLKIPLYFDKKLLKNKKIDITNFKEHLSKKVKSFVSGEENRYLKFYLEHFTFSDEYIDKLFEINRELFSINEAINEL